MNNYDFFGVMLSGFIGALTNLFHALYRNRIKDGRQLLIRFVISMLAICPAYLFCEYMNFKRDRGRGILCSKWRVAGVMKESGTS